MASSSAYCALPCDRSLRLLTITGIHETEGKATSITCKLDTFKLDEHCPSYVALSYTWGPPYDDPKTIEEYSADHDVTVSVQHGDKTSCQHRIGRNLFEALVQIHKSEWQSFLWADALCINQDDRDERGHQVELMGDIYSSCDYVVAWLGPEPENVADVLWWYGPFVDYLQNYQSDAEPKMSYTLYRSGFKIPHVTEYDMGRLNLEGVLDIDGRGLKLNKRRFLAIHNWLATTQYFRRLWVLQELYLSRKVMYRLGQHRLSLLPQFAEEDIQDLIHSWFLNSQAILETTLAVDNVRTRVVAESPVFHAVRVLKSFSQPAGPSHPQLISTETFGDRESGPYGLGILAFLSAFVSELVASDPRDKVYGLLGALKRVAPRSTTFPVADYRMTTRELMTRLSITFHTELPYLNAFGLRRPAANRQVPDLPSWVLDIVSVGAQVGWPLGVASCHSTSAHICDSSSATKAIVARDGDILRLDAHFCGEVGRVLPILRVTGSGRNSDQADRVFFPSILALACELGSAYKWKEHQAVFEALLETLAPELGRDAISGFWLSLVDFFVTIVRSRASTDPEVAEASTVLLDDCDRSFRWLLDRCAMPPRFDEAIRAVAEQSVDDSATFSRIHDEEMNRRRLLEHFEGMQTDALVVTNDGHIGLASRDVKPGDQVWSFCRARVPQILRPLPDGTFISIGEAYIHGGMHNELLELGIATSARNIAIV